MTDSLESGETPSGNLRPETTQEFCEFILGRWLVANGYVSSDQASHLSSIIMMISSDVEGAEVRLVIDPLPMEFIKQNGYVMKVRYGSSDHVIGKSTYKIVPAGKNVVSQVGESNTLEDHVGIISEALTGVRPIGVDVRLTYPPQGMSDTSEVVGVE